MNQKIKNSLPKNVIAGQLANLRMDSRGETFITLEVVNEEEKISEKVEFLIDTGFNGFIQLDTKLINSLKLKVIDKSTTTGFDGVVKEVGIVKTKIKLLDQEIYNFPIQVVEGGNRLLGTSLLKDLQRMLIIDYRSGIITLTDEKKVQKKVHKAVEKYHR